MSDPSFYDGLFRIAPENQAEVVGIPNGSELVMAEKTDPVGEDD